MSLSLVLQTSLLEPELKESTFANWNHYDNDGPQTTINMVYLVFEEAVERDSDIWWEKTTTKTTRIDNSIIVSLNREQRY